MTDSCPDCVQPGIEPIAERRQGDDMTHDYQCPACGHKWFTSRYLPIYSEIHQQSAQPRRPAA